MFLRLRLCVEAQLCALFFPLRVSLGSESSSWPVSVTQPTGLWNDPPQGSPGDRQPLSAVPYTLLLSNSVLFRFLLCFFAALYSICTPHSVTLFSLTQTELLAFLFFSRDVHFSVWNRLIVREGREKGLFFDNYWNFSKNMNNLSQQPVMLSVFFGCVWCSSIMYKMRRPICFIYFLVNALPYLHNTCTPPVGPVSLKLGVFFMLWAWFLEQHSCCYGP